MKRDPVAAGTLVVIAAGALAFLACWSYSDTAFQWDGGFPAGEFHLTLRDEGGKAIEGAEFHVYRGGTRDLTFDYPIENHVAGRTLASDSKGEIVLLRTNDALQFGGRSWRLFWVIPMGARGPQYDCEITAGGFKPLRFSIWDLFKSPETGEQKTLKVGGNKFELRVHDHSMTMTR